jgi:hypothetical protein
MLGLPIIEVAILFMKILRWLIWIVVCWCLPLQVLATAAAVVETVQEAAALERHGGQQPLKKNTELRSGDVITTGVDARVLIRLSDGSLVRLGAFTRFSFDELSLSDQGGNGVLSGAWSILKGVFRFTTGSAGKHDVKVQVGKTIALGIRGTEVFAKVGVDKDIVCLITGHVQVQAGNVTAVLNKPRHYFIVPKGQPPESVGFVEEEKLQEWLKSTELSE